MKRPFRLALILALAGSLATPALADRDRGRDRHDRQERHHHQRHDDDRRHHHRQEVRWHCPPGLMKKDRACVPPGQARKHSRHNPRVGEYLRAGDYRFIGDPRRYALEQRRGWDYYRDDDRIYRVDSSTRRILAVLELINAFSN
ncbi:hypothetical protein [Paracoccus sp. TOH]|uniref:Excinuclease ABC subunit A n=1 Tax=Paracoccus simplex TaxID=2086346 RepID=A0ABV7RVT4_9RHOB|nr:hypothetical protein [Paracoccus sp. TOH]WJS86772.1 hypothetical protein NBE95_20140 [Paracoccus sp. TOH]